MQPTRLAALSLAALVLAGCPGIPKDLKHASVIAYWSESHPAALRCSAGTQCTRYFSKLEKLEQAVKDQCGVGNQLVRLDAIRTSKGMLFIGIWQPSSLEHVFEPAMATTEFAEQHANRSAKHRLVHFSIWQDVNGSRISAVWRKRETGDTDPAEVVEIGLGLDDFPRTKTGFYIDELELYPPAITGDPPLVAVLWRPGTTETQVLHGERCHAAPDNIESSSTLGGGCTIDADLSSDAEQDEMCPALQALHDNYPSGFRAKDLELYVEGVEQRLAILLQKTGGEDWLMMPGSWEAVNCRHEGLGSVAEGETPLGLLDLDVMPLDSWTNAGHATHNGLVHDSGTGGPP